MPQILKFGDHVIGVTQVVTAHVSGAAAGTAKAQPVLVADQDITISKVRWLPQAAVTGAATNNFALGVVDKAADGSGTTAVTAVKTYASGTDSVANAPETLTLSTTDANLDIAAGAALVLDKTENGTGLEQPEGVVVVEYTYR